METDATGGRLPESAEENHRPSERPSGRASAGPSGSAVISCSTGLREPGYCRGPSALSGADAELMESAGATETSFNTADATEPSVAGAPVMFDYRVCLAHAPMDIFAISCDQSRLPATDACKVCPGLSEGTGKTMQVARTRRHSLPQ